MNVIQPGNDAMRASDQDREGVVAVLCDAYAAGRLGLTDIRDRASAAYRARTWGDLCRLTVDLPCHQVLRPASPELQRGTRFRQAPKPSCAPILLAVLAVLAMSAAVLVPAAFAPPVPLAGLALITISLSALFAACLTASCRDPAVTSINIYEFQALVALHDGDGSRRAKLVSMPRRVALQARNDKNGRSQTFDALVSRDNDAPFRPGSRQVLVTLRLAAHDVEDYLAVGGRFDLRLGDVVGRGVVTRRLFT